MAPGEIVVADFPASPQPSTLLRFDAAGNPLGTFAGAAEGIVAPRDLAFDVAGNLYVADNAAVLVLDGSGSPLPSITQGLTKALALAFDGSGHLFVSNRISGGASEILEYSPAGGCPLCVRALIDSQGLALLPHAISRVRHVHMRYP